MPVANTTFKPIVSQAAEILTKLENRITLGYPGLLEQFPPGGYVQLLDNTDPLRNLCHVPPPVREWCNRISDAGDPGAVGSYHKLVLAYLVSDFNNRIKGLQIPAPILTLVATSFEKILGQLEDAENSFYLFDNELFCKDIALCRLKLLPCGAEFVDTFSGVPRSILASDGLQQFLRCSRFFLRRGRGFRPWYESHWDRRLIRYFTPEDYDQCYLRIAQLLELHPDIRGMTGSSWWFDPALKSISPELVFLHKVPVENGAQLYRVGRSAAATRAAIRFSAGRKRLYDAGEYRPVVYLLVWAREDLLEWASHYTA